MAQLNVNANNVEANRLARANSSLVPSPSIIGSSNNYSNQRTFPRNKLSSPVSDRVPLVIVACGSFSPVTYLHLRMFEMAQDYVRDGQIYEIIGMYFSPVSDRYNKPGLASWNHRVEMCELAVKDHELLMVDSWVQSTLPFNIGRYSKSFIIRASQPVYIRTIQVLEHFDMEINGTESKGLLQSDGSYKYVKIMLLAGISYNLFINQGGDLIQSFAIPNLWSENDLDGILGKFGCFIIERKGADVYDFLLMNDHLFRHRKSCHVVKQAIHNDISSTKIRLFIKRKMSIKYLTPETGYLLSLINQ